MTPPIPTDSDTVWPEGAAPADDRPDRLVEAGLKYARIWGLSPVVTHNPAVVGSFAPGNRDAHRLIGYLDGRAEDLCPGISGALFEGVLARICTRRRIEEPTSVGSWLFRWFS